MRVVVDGRPLLTRERTGIGVYTKEAIEATAAAALDIHFEVIFTGKEALLDYAPKFSGPNISVTKVVFSNRMLGVGSRFNLLPFERFAQVKPDAIWFPGVTPGWTTLPYALTIHDLSPFITPQFYTLKDRVYQQVVHLCTRAQEADQLLAVSEATARDLQTFWKIEPKKITVTTLGVDTQVFKPREQPADRNFRAAYDLNRPYFAALATREPRKNLESVIEAYVAFRAGTPQGPALALIGGAGWKSKHLERLVESAHLERDILLLGYVPRAHLGALLRGAEALIFPSFYEGFGLPVLEALACGTPVITSAIPAHFEVVGEAARAVYFVDPFNVTDIKRGLQEIADNQAEWRAEAQRLGPEQAAQFSWKALGQKTAEALRAL
jgi:glycosyltransferase involved in cell wall biosynthesis